MSIDKTINSIFIVPTLKIEENSIYDNSFINGYEWDINRDDNYENAIYLLFKPNNIQRFKEFINKEYNRGEYSDSPLIEDYSYDEFIVMIYSLNPKYDADFKLIKQGKYSKTSTEFKEQFKKTKVVMERGFPREKTSLQWKIFNKSDDLKEYWENKIAIDFTDNMEVWEGYDKEKEKLDINKIKQLL